MAPKVAKPLTTTRDCRCVVGWMLGGMFVDWLCLLEGCWVTVWGCWLASEPYRLPFGEQLWASFLRVVLFRVRMYNIICSLSAAPNAPATRGDHGTNVQRTRGPTCNSTTPRSHPQAPGRRTTHHHRAAESTKLATHKQGRCIWFLAMGRKLYAPPRLCGRLAATRPSICGDVK